MLLHCLQAMSFPFVKGVDHSQMLHNILGSPLAHGEIDNQVIDFIYFFFINLIENILDNDACLEVSDWRLQLSLTGVADNFCFP